MMKKARSWKAMSSMGVMMMFRFTGPEGPPLCACRLAMRISKERLARPHTRLGSPRLCAAGHDADLPAFEAGPLARMQDFPHLRVTGVLVSTDDHDQLHLAGPAPRSGHAFEIFFLARQVRLEF